jgi:D-alanine-D-alanine ligase
MLDIGFSSESEVIYLNKQSEDVPLGPIKVGVVFNQRHVDAPENAAPDAQAEFDSMDTVLAIERAIRAGGCDTVLLEANETLAERLVLERPDIAFNIAEGFGGRGREAQAPARPSWTRAPHWATRRCCSRA